MASAGFSDAEVGLVFTAMLAGMAISSVAVGLLGDSFGRRRTYSFLLLMMGASGAVFALTSWLPALLIAALTGTLSTDPNESGPITSVEQSMMGSAPAGERARVFGRYNAVAYVAGSVGSLAAGGPAVIRALLPHAPHDRSFLLVFPLIAAMCVGIASRLPHEVEREGTGERRAPLHRSRRTVIRLSMLFALDAGAGGFVVQAFIVFWFHRRFGAGSALMGGVFFAAGLLQAISSIAAGRLAGKIGLLNTMVFTHLPSNLLLVLVAFAPNLPSAIALLLVRFAMSQMDVPARQAYVVAMVDPDERTAASAFTNTARYIARPAGPFAAGAMLQTNLIAGPFVVAGGLKIVYDLALFFTFRKVALPKQD